MLVTATRVVIKVGASPLLKRDIKTLYAENWLNGVVIDAYLGDVLESYYAPPRCAFVSSQFYNKITGEIRDDNTADIIGYEKGDALRKILAESVTWHGIANMYNYERVFMPINMDNTHWVLVVFDVPQRKTHFFDPFGPGKQYYTRVRDALTKYFTEPDPYPETDDNGNKIWGGYFIDQFDGMDPNPTDRP